MFALLVLAGAWQCLPYYASGSLAMLALLVLAGLGSACCAREHLWMLEWHGKLYENLAVTLESLLHCSHTRVISNHHVLSIGLSSQILSVK